MKAIFNNYETNTQTLFKYGFFKKLDYYTQNEEALKKLFKRIERHEKINKSIGGIMK